jgi:antitoxin component YwqK of YwqJK toxin-antitoxin module
MNKYIVTIILIIGVLFITSAQQAVYDSFENGKRRKITKQERVFYNYLKERQDSFYVFDSLVYVTIEYDVNEDSLMHGSYKVYYQNNINRGDILISKGTFKGGLAHGVFVNYIGTDSSFVTFFNGRKQGEQVDFTRRIKSVKNYDNGVLSGYSYAVYNETGALKESRNYFKGKLVGGEFDYYANGALHAYNIYENGKLLDGEYFVFNQDGSVFGSYQIKNGLQDGVQYQMNEDGCVYEVRLYKKGKRSEKFYRLHDNKTVALFNSQNNSVKLIPKDKVKYFAKCSKID